MPFVLNPLTGQLDEVRSNASVAAAAEIYPACHYVVKSPATWSPASTSDADLDGCATLAAGERVLCPSGANVGIYVASSATVCTADPSFVVREGYTARCVRSAGAPVYQQTATSGAPVFEPLTATIAGASLAQTASQLRDVISIVNAASVATAASVTTLPDSGPARTTITQSSAGARAASVELGTGEQVIRFVGATPTWYAAQYHTHLGSAFSAVARVARNSIGADQNVMGMSGAGSELLQVFLSSTNTVSMFLRDGGAAVRISVGSTQTIADTAEHCVAWIRDANRTTLVLDGAHTSSVAAAFTEPAWTASTVGAANPAGANPLNGDLYSLLVTRDTISPAEYKATYRAVMGRPCCRVICSGNSLTAGQGASAAQYYYPAQLAGALNAGGEYARSVSNLGHGGYQTSQLIAGFADEAHTLILPYSEMVAVLWEGGNAVYFGASAATVVAQIWKWCSMYRQNGCKVVVLDIIARGNYSEQAAMTAIAADVNALLAAEWRSHCDALVQVSKVLTDYNDTTKYDADKCHLTDSGYADIAATTAPAVIRALG